MLVVNTAIHTKERTNNLVIIIGNDTDLFVIIIALTLDNSNVDFCKYLVVKNQTRFTQLLLTRKLNHWFYLHMRLKGMILQVIYSEKAKNLF